MFLATLADGKTAASWGEGEKTAKTHPEVGFGWVLIGWVLAPPPKKDVLLNPRRASIDPLERFYLTPKGSIQSPEKVL